MDSTYKLPPELQRELDLQKVEHTLSQAEIRCLTWDKIRPRIHSIWEDQQAEEIIQRVQELTFSSDESEELAREIQHLSTIAEQLRSQDRSKLDRNLIRLALALPQHLLCELALTDLDHHRKLRRQGAYRMLRNININAELAQRLVEKYNLRKDQKLLELIARCPEAIQVVDVIWILGQLDEQYWRMRVIQVLMQVGDNRAIQLSSTYPREFVHAAGRLGANDFTAVVMDLVRTHSSDLELLSLSAWALGKIGNQDRLADIRRILEHERAKDTINLMGKRG